MARGIVGNLMSSDDRGGDTTTMGGLNKAGDIMKKACLLTPDQKDEWLGRLLRASRELEEISQENKEQLSID